MRFQFHRRRFVWTIVAAGCLSATGALASENGQIHYPLGVNTIMNAALPGPDDTGFYSYSQYYWSSRLNDGSGRSIDPDFKVSVIAEAPRVVHNWGQKLGPFFVASAAITPITRVRLRAFGRKDSSIGLGDPVVTPFYFYYINNKGNFFIYFGPDVYVPIGKYDRFRLANNAAHYWAVAPNASATWLPTPKIEVSTTIYSELNWANKATRYRSGNVISMDLAVAYRPIEQLSKLKIAVQCYGHKQVSNDHIDGIVVQNGNKGQAFAIGPQVSYDIAGSRGGILAKYQREFAVENRSLGNRLWFELAFPI